MLFTTGIDHVCTSIDGGFIFGFDAVIGRESTDDIVKSDDDLCLIGDSFRKIGRNQNDLRARIIKCIRQCAIRYNVSI